ncbi:MAG: helix-turn-helix transcriptional regulator [Deltaproteobacteria bacterium]|nr:helix-turn-helix transcriptional regulator [Deltaproteobacteria bacterium]
MGLFAFIAVLVGIDVIDDSLSGTSIGHVAAEVAVALIAWLGAALAGWTLLREARAARGRAAALRGELSAAREDAERWRTEARSVVRGLASAIDTQLVRWQLTAAEREVAMLLLKGLSLKDIAEVRGTSERTVRQQSLSVYRKAGLAGRAELSAFFLEDLLEPPSAQPRDTTGTA